MRSLRPALAWKSRRWGRWIPSALARSSRVWLKRSYASYLTLARPPRVAAQGDLLVPAPTSFLTFCPLLMPSLLQVLTRQDLAPSSRLTRSCLGRPRGSCRSRKTLSRLQELELDGRLDTGQATLKVPRPQQEPYIFSKDKANKGGKFVLLEAGRQARERVLGGEAQPLTAFNGPTVWAAGGLCAARRARSPASSAAASWSPGRSRLCSTGRARSPNRNRFESWMMPCSES